MTIEAQLFDDKFVKVDDRTALLGGSFYFEPLRAYSPLPLRWCWDQLIRYPSATLIDIGASTGCYTLLSAHHPDLWVHSFEPVPLTNRVLCENVYLNGLQDKVTVNQCAVSDYDGTGTMNIVVSDGGKGVSIFGGLPAWHKVTEPLEVDVVTIDSYCEKYAIVPSMIKSDCEGLDELVLKGAAATIQKHHPFLLFEYSQENADQFGLTASATIEMIESWGYTWLNPEGTDIFAVPVGWEELIK